MKIRKGFVLIVLFSVVLTMSVGISFVKAATPEEIQDAINLALPWLAARQNADGSWGGSYRVARTGFAVLKFETHAVHQGIDPLDPSYDYYDQVRKGLDYLFSRSFTMSISVQPAGDPDTDGDGIGVRIYYDSSHRMYETGIAAMALAASTHPEMIVSVAGSAVDGWTYEQVLQDVVDYISYGQTDAGSGRGGWRYSENYGSSDNSVSGYATLGLVYAESPPPIGFGLTVPQFVKDELEIWINYVQTSGGSYDGGSGYTGPGGGNILRTGNLLQQMAFIGYPLGDSRVERAIAFIERFWNDLSTDPGWKNGTNSHMQAAYTCMKGFEAYNIDLIDTDGDTVRDDDWFDEMSTKIVGEQYATGYWPTDPWGDSELATEWAILVLQREAPPVLKYDLTVHVTDASTGDPISGASVDLVGPEPRSGVTGADGSVVFSELLVGDYTATASAVGYLPGSEALTLDMDKTIEIELTREDFFVIPEVPLGTIMISAAMIIALAAYIAVPKWRRK